MGVFGVRVCWWGLCVGGGSVWMVGGFVGICGASCVCVAPGPCCSCWSPLPSPPPPTPPPHTHTHLPLLDPLPLHPWVLPPKSPPCPPTACLCLETGLVSHQPPSATVLSTGVRRQLTVVSLSLLLLLVSVPLLDPWIFVCLCVCLCRFGRCVCVCMRLGTPQGTSAIPSA